MNKHLFSNELKGEKIAKRLSLCATILQVAAVLLAIIIFLTGLIFGIILLSSNNQSSNNTKTNQNSSYQNNDQSNDNRGTNNRNDYYYDSGDTPFESLSSTDTTTTVGSIFSTFGVAVILVSIFASIYVLALFFLIALLLKALAAIVLHTYITALNTDKIADNTFHCEK